MKHVSEQVLIEFLDGSLASAERTSLEKHLDDCLACQHQLARLTSDSVTEKWRGLLKKSRKYREEFDRIARNSLSAKLSCGRLESATENDRTSLPTVPGYAVLAEIGRGGMGVVYRAIDLALNREVALKMILAGNQASVAESARFKREAETLASLRHPNIVQIFDAGSADGGIYLAMELIEGPTLAQVIHGKPQAAHVAAGIVATLANATHHAHEQGVIHRDLKPANILLSNGWPSASCETKATSSSDTSCSALAIPKIADFGLAKRPDEVSGATRTGEFMGTPSYTAPEQALGTGSITPAIDVHALGGILYELLTGRPPFQGEISLETLFQVIHEAPVSPDRLRPQLPHDLVTICMKCLAKEPRKRYLNAAALAADLRRFLDGKPILARPIPLWERAWKWSVRNPTVAALSLGIALVTLIGFGLVLHQSQKATDLAFAEKKARQDETEARQAAERLLAGSFLDQGISLCERSNISTGLLWMVRSLALAETLNDEMLARAVRANLAGWSQQQFRLRQSFPNTDWTTSVAFSPDGKLALTGHKDKTARLWDAMTGEPIGEPMTHEFPVWTVAFSPNGSTILTGSGTDDPFYAREGVWVIAPHSAGQRFGVSEQSGRGSGEARLWDARTGKQLGAPLAHSGSVASVQWSRDGNRILAVGNGRATIWNGVESLRSGVSTLRPIELPHPKGVLAASFDPRGAIAVTGGADGTARQWLAASGQSVGSPLQHRGPVNVTLFHPNGSTLLTGSYWLDPGSGKPQGGEARLWNIDTGQSAGPPVAHRGPLKGAAFSSDGQIAVTGGYVCSGQDLSDSTGEARTWNTNDGQLIGPVLEHPEVVTAVACAGNGRLAATGCRDSQVRLWLPRSAKCFVRSNEPTKRFNYGTVSGLTFSPDGRALLAASLTDLSCAQLFEVPTASELAIPLRHAAIVNMAVFSPDGGTILTGSFDRTARLWDSRTGRPLCPPVVHPMPISLVAFHPDGKRFATCGPLGEISLWDAATQKLLGQPVSKPEQILTLTFSPDGKDLVIDNSKYQMCFWDLATGQIRLKWNHQVRASHAVFSRDGRMLLTGSLDGYARLWDSNTGTLLKQLKHFPTVTRVAFSPDEKLIALGGETRAAQLWSLEGDPLGLPLAHLNVAGHVAFSPDGRLLATGSRDKTARLWDVATGKAIGPPLEHPDELFHVAFHPRSDMLLTACKDGTAHRWEIAPPVAGAVEKIRQWVESITGMQMDAKGIVREIAVKRAE